MIVASRRFTQVFQRLLDKMVLKVSSSVKRMSSGLSSFLICRRSALVSRDRTLSGTRNVFFRKLKRERESVQRLFEFFSSFRVTVNQNNGEQYFASNLLLARPFSRNGEYLECSPYFPNLLVLTFVQSKICHLRLQALEKLKQVEKLRRNIQEISDLKPSDVTDLVQPLLFKVMFLRSLGHVWQSYRLVVHVVFSPRLPVVLQQNCEPFFAYLLLGRAFDRIL